MNLAKNIRITAKRVLRNEANAIFNLVDFIDGDVPAFAGFPDAGFGDDSFVFTQPAVGPLVDLVLCDQKACGGVIGRLPCRVLILLNASLQNRREEQCSG